jgi:hypothetical protein
MEDLVGEMFHILQRNPMLNLRYLRIVNKYKHPERDGLYI